MNFLASLLAAIPAIERLVLVIVKALAEAEKKNQKENFKKAIEKAILNGDQRELDSGLPSGHSGVRVVEKDKS
jgi:hypothetical protein